MTQPNSKGVEEMLTNQKWALQMQEKHAVQYYKEHWNGCEVIEIDSLGFNSNGEGTGEALKNFDYSGMDKAVIDKNGSLILIAQRIRPDTLKFSDDDDSYGVDFSFRTQCRGDYKAELEKLRLAKQNKHAAVPVYAFGIADVCKDKDKHTSLNWRSIALERGMKYFAIYDLNKLLTDFFNDEIPYNEPGGNGDGTEGIYINLKDIDEYVIRKWEDNEEMEKPSLNEW